MRFYIDMKYTMDPTKLLIQDPCPLGQPEILTVAHIEHATLRSEVCK